MLKDLAFSADSCPIDIVDNHQYLGIKLKPSGSMHLAADDLFAKAYGKCYSPPPLGIADRVAANNKGLYLSPP